MELFEMPIFNSASQYSSSPIFVTFGETIIRDTPVDDLRPEQTRRVAISLAGSELTLATLLSRFGVPSAYVTRVPDNPYGWLLRDTARSQGVNTEYFVWAPKAEPIGRFIYEIGRTPRKNTGWYQRMYSASSRLDAGMVKWQECLRDCRLFHTSGINFGLATHSGYSSNYLLNAFEEATETMPEDCLIGLDFNYRNTLWSPEDCKEVMTPLIDNHVDILITTIEDVAKIYDIGCGQYSPQSIVDGEIDEISDQDIKSLVQELFYRFRLKVVAITLRYPDSFEIHRWESVVMDVEGNFFRSRAKREIRLLDRLGGGDTWNGGFYYGLLCDGVNPLGMERGLIIGDAATRLKQTLMFDLPIVTKGEVEALIKSDLVGGGKRTVR